MCLLIARKARSAWKPTKEEFTNAWNVNPDGFGIAYAKGGKIHITKTLKEETAWKQIEKLPDNVPAILHWRMGTHGSVSIENVHPFNLPNLKDRRYWIGAHNGVLSSMPCERDLTDSESYFRTLKRISIPDIERDIARLGYGKMSFLSNQGDLLLANESHGSWRNSETWQSNNGLDAHSYCGFGFGGGTGGSYWKPYKGKAPFDLTPLECCVCSSLTVSYREGFDFYCEQCATYPELR
jgi:hypothetical protein